MGRFGPQLHRAPNGSGRTITPQGAAVFSSADKLRKDLLQRAATLLKVDAAQLKIMDGVISSTKIPKRERRLRANKAE
jgi:hypothetical protein